MREGEGAELGDDLARVALSARCGDDGVPDLDASVLGRAEEPRARDEGVSRARAGACHGVPGEPPDAGRALRGEAVAKELLRAPVVLARRPVVRNRSAEDGLKRGAASELGFDVFKVGGDEDEARRVTFQRSQGEKGRRRARGG